MKTNKIWKRIAKIIVILYFIIFCVPALIFAIIRIPAVQNAIVNKVVTYLADELDTHISLGGIYIDFFLNIVVKDFEVYDQEGGKLLLVEKLSVAFKDISLRKNTIFFNKVELNKPEFYLKKYSNSQTTNLQFIIDFFKSDKEKKPTPWTINSQMLIINDAVFIYLNEHKDTAINNQINFNNLNIQKINLSATDLCVEDTIFANIEYLSFKDHSGFDVRKFSGNCKVHNEFIDVKKLKINTPVSDINADLTMSYENFRSFNNFIDAVELDADFLPSKLHAKDISFFTKTLNDVLLWIDFSGYASGSISNLSASDFLISTAGSTDIMISGQVIGLPEINETFFDANIKSFNSSSSDIENILLSTGLKNTQIKDFPDLSYIRLNGKFIGFLNDFYTEITINSNIGGIEANLSIDMSNKNNPVYKGCLKTNRLDIAQLTKNNLLGIITSDLNIEGRGFDIKTANITAIGEVMDFTFNNYNYSGINLKGKFFNSIFDGDIKISDDNVRLDFTGMVDFSDSLPQFLCNVIIAQANLNALNFNRNASLSSIRGVGEFSFKGNSIDNLYGFVKLNSINYFEGDKNYIVNQFNFNQTINQEESKLINIQSDIFNGRFSGQFNFADFPAAINRFISEYITNIKQDSMLISDVFKIDFDVEINNFAPISGLFLPDLKVSTNSVLSGSFDANKNELLVQIDGEQIEHAGIKAAPLQVKARTKGKNIDVNLLTNKLYLKDSLHIDNFSFAGKVFPDSINYFVLWDNQDETNNISGKINGELVFLSDPLFKMYMSNSEIVFNNKKWIIDENNIIEFYNDPLLSIKNIKIISENECLSINGLVSKYDKDALEINFINFRVDNINPFLKEHNMGGALNGVFSLYKLLDAPYFTSNIKITDYLFNNDLLGDVSVLSNYNNHSKSIYSELVVEKEGSIGVSEPIIANGYLFLDINTIYYSINVSNFDIKIFQPFVEKHFKILSGKVSGDIVVSGKFDNPDVSGTIKLMRGQVFVNYLNAPFSFAHDIHFTKNRIYAEDMLINDLRGRRASVNANISHNNFKDFYIDAKVNTLGDFQFMNTTSNDNEQFYGSVVANGLITAKGKLDDITMNINAQTGRGTQFSIPITETGNVSESSFITYVPAKTQNPNQQSQINNQQSQTQSSQNFKLLMDLEVTDDAELQIIFDPKVGDVMRGKGVGNLKIDFDMQGDFLMFGDLELYSGDYLFTLENIINKRFFIKQGGIIKWSGSPYDALIDITTYYPLRTSLSPLIGEDIENIDNPDLYRRNIPVHLELMLKNNLMNPDISFNIALPQSDENVSNVVNSKIDSDKELNRQVFALLILNSFVTPEQAQFDSPLAQGVGTTSSELLSNQLSNWLSQISKDFDIGVNYRPGGEISTDEVEVALSTQLFNERIIIDGNVGVSGQRIGEDNAQNNQVLGDVNIEYKITPDGRVSLKAFYRSNPNDLILQASPNSQGVGIFYRRNFDRLGELFKKRKKMRE